MEKILVKENKFQEFRKSIKENLNKEVELQFENKTIVWNFNKEKFANVNPTHVTQEEYMENMLEKEILEIYQHLILGGVRVLKGDKYGIEKMEKYTINEEEKKEMETAVVKPEIDRDLLIEVGQEYSKGNLISLEIIENGVEYLVEEENEEVLVKFTYEDIKKMAQEYGLIKIKEIKVTNKAGLVLEFQTINDFYNHLLAETGKEKINKGLLYNLKNGKSKSCYGYKLA